VLASVRGVRADASLRLRDLGLSASVNAVSIDVDALADAAPSDGSVGDPPRDPAPPVVLVVGRAEDSDGSPGGLDDDAFVTARIETCSVGSPSFDAAAAAADVTAALSITSIDVALGVVACHVSPAAARAFAACSARALRAYEKALIGAVFAQSPQPLALAAPSTPAYIAPPPPAAAATIMNVRAPLISLRVDDAADGAVRRALRPHRALFRSRPIAPHPAPRPCRRTARPAYRASSRCARSRSRPGRSPTRRAT
jgi:hypothetical protein